MNVSYDPGYGNSKLYASSGSIVMQSAVSVGDGQRLRRMTGLRISKAPLEINTRAGTFHVGVGAHDWGRPVESLDFDRLSGSPEMMALWYGAMTKLGVPEGDIDLIVGLPIHVLLGEEASTTQREVKKALLGAHQWQADGAAQTMTVASVRITSQPVGAMFDYLLDDQGQMLPSRRAAFGGEIGILGIGMNTMDLLVVRNGSPVQRFTGGETLGVRRLLEILDSQGTYSLAERDDMLRAGQLITDDALALWRSEVLGYIERQWSGAFTRFKVIVAAGGGSVLLRDALLKRFRAKMYLPDDPILATARGLHKYATMRQRRSDHGGDR